MIGGNQQSTNSITSSLVFNPTITIGDDNQQEQNQATDLTSSVTPKQDNATQASVGVGVGGDGSGGEVSRSQREDTPQPLNSLEAGKNMFSGFGGSPIMLVLSAVSIGGLIYYMKRK